MTKWQLKPRVKKKRTHYGKCDVIGFSCFFIFFVHSFDPKKKKKEHIMQNEKKKKQN